MHLPNGTQLRQWTVEKKLGEGAFGSVYQVSRIEPKANEACAMKTEPRSEEDSMIKMEVAVLKSFRNSPRAHPHVCDYVDSGMTSSIRYVVMKLAGPNLADVQKICPRGRFSESTTIRVGIQCLDSIEQLHAIGFLHRDIKPPNYAIGLGQNQRNLFLLDYGLARQFVDRNGHIRPPRSKVGFRGTVRYASLNAHLKKDLGRHDDIWSLLYMLIEIHRDKLPWRKTDAKDKVGELKKNTVADKLLRGMAPEFQDFLNELHSLQFKDAPDYEWFREKLRSILIRKGLDAKAPYDWEDDIGNGSGRSKSVTVRTASIAQQPFKRQKREQRHVRFERDGEERSRLSEN